MAGQPDDVAFGLERRCCVVWFVVPDLFADVEFWVLVAAVRQHIDGDAGQIAVVFYVCVSFVVVGIGPEESGPTVVLNFEETPHLGSLFVEQRCLFLPV